MSQYYTYTHHAGYGRDDHMAEEIIARAARQLGLDTGNSIAQHVGLASHAVPTGTGTVRLPDKPGVRERMVKALRAARAEVPRINDCRIDVELRRETHEILESRDWVDQSTLERRGWRLIRTTIEVKSGRGWRAESIETREVDV